MKNTNSIEYLTMRGVTNKEFVNFWQESLTHKYSFIECKLNNFEFLVNCFFDNSDTIGYGIVPTNRILGTDKTNFIAIGSIEGDDIICLDINTGKINIWMIETGDGEFIEVSDTFVNFFKSVTK